MNPTVTPLTTLATVKAEMGITGTEQDARLERLIAQASSLIATYCGREFGMQSVTETFDKEGVDYSRIRPLILSCYPVSALTSVTGSAGLIDLADVALEPGSGLLHRRSNGALAAWGGQFPVTVVYSSGYADIPPDLEAIALSLVVSAGSRTVRDPGVKVETTEGVGRTEWFETTSAATMTLDSALRAQLTAYRVRA